MKEIKFAPREIFEEILEWAVIPTFDLIVVYGNGVIIVKRKIAPYNNSWALPGLRMFKGENIDDTLERIALKELGIKIDTSNKVLLGQFVGKFRSEKNRQDISTAYVVGANTNQSLKLNPDHFSMLKIIKSNKKIPKPTGAMYRYYLEKYFKR